MSGEACVRSCTACGVTREIAVVVKRGWAPIPACTSGVERTGVPEIA